MFCGDICSEQWLWLIAVAAPLLHNEDILILGVDLSQ
jgi:hypothetical protein